MATTTESIKSSVVISRPAKKAPLKSFRDLRTWQLARDLAVAVYRQCELFPAPEGSLLSCQMTQASVGTCANIAESFSKRGEERERLFGSAQAALNRLENYVFIGQELGFIGQGACTDLTRRVSNTRWALLKLQKINREWMER